MPDVILPALNESAAVEWVLGRMPDGYRPIVVDNGSSDRTAEIAESMGATVVHEAVRGFGSACWAGLQAATADIVCFMDCDASLDAVALPMLVGYVERGEAELVMGARIAARGAWPAHARLANRLLALEVRRRTGLRLADLGPMRTARREALLALNLRDRRSGWPLEMVLRAREAGWHIRNVPVEYSERGEGRSKVTGTVRGDRSGHQRHGSAVARPEQSLKMHLSIIAKAPIAGKVKTRLCPPCTFEQAATVAAASLADTFAAADTVAAATGRGRVLLLDGDRQDWMPSMFENGEPAR